MPKGVYTRKSFTEEHKKHIKEAKKGKSSSTKGNLNGMFGKHHSEESKKKMREANRKKSSPFSEVHKKHMSEARKGKPLTEEHKQHIGEAGKGRIAWNKGKHLSEEHKKHLNKALWKGGRKESRRRSYNKRRNFDFVPLNEFFTGSVAHHLDRIYIIYMPEIDHQSIYHSVLKDINMDTINALAFNYLKC